MRLKDQRQKRLLPFQREALSPLPKRIPRVVFRTGKQPRVIFDPVEIAPQVGQLGHLDRMRGSPKGGILDRFQKRHTEFGSLFRAGPWQGPYTGQGLFLCRHPVVEKNRMPHEERGHAKPGRVANTEAAAHGLFKAGRFRPAFHRRQMFGKIDGEFSGQPNREHLGLKRRRHLGAVRDLGAVGGAELARAINRGRPHQIAHGIDLVGIGLLPFGQTPDHMIEKPHRAVGAAERQFARSDPARLLQGNVGLKPVKIGPRQFAIEKGKGRVPSCGDHAVRPHLGRQVVGKGHKAIAPLRPLGAIDGATNAPFVNLPDRPIKAPAFIAHPPQHDAQERQARGMGRAHPCHPHHLGRRAAEALGGVQTAPSGPKLSA